MCTVRRRPATELYARFKAAAIPLDEDGTAKLLYRPQAQYDLLVRRYGAGQRKNDDEHPPATLERDLL